MIHTCKLSPMQASLVLSYLPVEIVGDPIPPNRLFDCVNVIMSYQVRLRDVVPID